MPASGNRPALSIRGRLLLLAILPMLAVFAFAGLRAASQWHARTEQAHIVGLVESSAAMAALAHQLQAERGATNTYVTTKGAKLGDRLPKLRAATDEALTKADGELADSGLPDDVIAPLAATVKEAHGITELRTQADGFSRPAPELVKAYTGVIESVLDTFGPIGQATSDANTARQITALSQISHAKEKAGLQRAQMTAVFAADRFAPGQRDRIRDLVSGQEAFFHAYAISGGQHAADELKALEATDAAEQVTAVTDAAMAKQSGFGQEPDQWFTTATAYVDSLRAIETRGYEAVIASSTAMAHDMQVRFWRTVIVVLLVLVSTVLIGIWTIRSIMRSLGSIETALHEMGAGRLDVRADVKGDDEIARMGHSLNTALDSLEGAMRRITDAALRLRQSADGMAGVAGGLTSSAGDSSSQARQASESADRVSSDIESLARSGEQLRTAIDDIARSAARAQQVVSGAVDQARHAASTVTELGESSLRIDEVLKTVSDISEQTNLLALNATIEAARAGEAGKGFAVVANEVKELAQATTSATEDIAGRIAKLRADTSAAATSITQVGSTIAEIDSIQTAIAAAVEEQSATTRDMAAHVEQAADSSRDIASRVDHVADAAGRTDTSAATTQGSAQSLSELSHELDGIVSKFRLTH